MRTFKTLFLILLVTLPFTIYSQYCGTATTNVTIIPTTTSQLTTSYSSGRRAFNFIATTGCVYEFSTCGQSTNDTYLRLYSTGTGGTLLAQNDNSCSTTQSTLTWTATVSGTVSVLLTRSPCNTLSVTTKMSYRRISCDPPPCTTPISPTNNLTGVNINQTLSWNSVNTSTSYDVYFGTNSSPPLVTNQVGTTYNPGTLNYSTTYYWKIVPKNSNGSSTSCSTWSFTTKPVGCLTSTYGQFPSSTYTPSCTGSSEIISTVCYASEYSLVSLLSGVNYTLSSSMSTDFITVSDANGTTVLTYGTGSVSFQPTLNDDYRFYVHTNNLCGSSTTSRSRIVQCLTPPPPSNDNCSGSIDVGKCGGTFNGSTQFATNNDGTNCIVDPFETWTAPGVWYKVNGNGQNITISTCGSSFDTKLYVYTGTCSNLSCFVSNDDFCGLQSEVTFQSTINTTYYILVTGYGSKRGSFNLNVTLDPSPPIINQQPQSINLCFGETKTISVTVSGVQSPLNYQWYKNGTIINGQIGSSLNVNSSGNYSVIVTNACGASVTSNVSVVTQSTEVTSTTNIQNISCFNQSTGFIYLTPSGGTSPYTYLWSNGSTNKDQTYLIAGTYSVVITDSKGCKDTNSVTLLQNTPIVITTTKTDVSCNGGSNGSITTSVTGGSPPYVYNWSNGSTQPNLSNLFSTNYSLIVTDSKGCSKSTIVYISQPPPLVLSLNNVINEPCGGGGGSVDVSVLGGTQPYSYNWSNGATTQDLNNLLNGNYTLNVFDSKGCVNVIIANVGKDTCYDPVIIGSECGIPFNTIKTYTVSNVSTGTCSWSVPYGSVIVSGQGTTTCGIKFSSYFVGGNISVNVVTPTSTFNLTKEIYKNPNSPYYISGDQYVCANGSTVYEYYVDSVSTATNYHWNVPNGVTLIDGQGNDTIHVKYNSTFVSGNIDVQSYNQCGTSPMTYLNVYNNNSNVSVGSISGSGDLCPYLGSTTTYSVQPQQGYTYTWVVPQGLTILSGQGTNLINVQVSPNFISGTLSVKMNEGCGNTQPSTLNLSTSQTIITSSNISGSTTVCTIVGTNQTSTYSVTPISGANYFWSVPTNATIVSGQNSNSINVSFQTGFNGGNISVLISGGCSQPITKSITLVTNPPNVNSIVGVKCVENGTSYNYSISSISGVLSYNWTVPGNSTITSGQGTNQITVFYPSNFETTCINNLCDSIKVTVQFTCGSTTKSIRIGMTTYPVTTVIGPPVTCPPDTIQLSVSPSVRSTNYFWGGPNGTQFINLTGLSQPNLGQIVNSKINSTFLGGNYNVQSINQCGSSPMRYFYVSKSCTAKMIGDTTITTNEEIYDEEWEKSLNKPIDFIVYPNPSTGDLQFRIFRGNDEYYLVTIYNKVGIIIYQGLKEKEDNIKLINIESGTYTIKVTDKDMNTISKQIIIL